MIPASANLLTKLPKGSPLIFQNLLKERDCRIVVTNNTAWSRGKMNMNVHVNINANIGSAYSLFDAINYPVVNSAFVIARQCGSDSKILFKCDEDQVSLIQKIIDNFCEKYSLSQSSISVIGTTQPESKSFLDQNVISFLTGSAKDFSVRLISEQVRSSKEVGGPGRLSKLLSELVYVLDLESSYKQHDTNVQLQTVSQPGLYNVLEHVVNRRSIPHLAAIQTPLFAIKHQAYPHQNFLTNTSYEIYQYCRKIPDSELHKALAYLTTFNLEEREDILKRHQIDPETCHGQMKIAENLLSIIKSADSNLLKDCITAAKLLHGMGKPTPLSKALFDSAENVCDTITIPYTPLMTLPQLCEQYHAVLPDLIKPKFDEFVESMIKNAKLRCNRKTIDLHHQFTEADMFTNRSVLVSKASAFLVKWDVKQNCLSSGTVISTT